jgi:hypothetical protein
MMAMKRRRLLLLLLLPVLGGLLLVPSVHWRVVGWGRGEAFYQGRPTSYWSRELNRWISASTQQGTATTDLIEQWFIWLGLASPDSKQPTILEGQADAIPVLRELAKDERPSIRWQAFRGWEKAENPNMVCKEALNDPALSIRRDYAFYVIASSFDEDVKMAAVPIFVEVIQRENRDWRISAAQALQSFGPKAKSAVPALTDALREPDAGLREACAKALNAIDPEDAAQAGVK